MLNITDYWQHWLNVYSCGWLCGDVVTRADHGDNRVLSPLGRPMKMK